MTSENKLREGLLRENGIEPIGLSDEDRLKLRKLLERDRSRVRHIKWITVAAWSLLALCFLIAYASRYFPDISPHWRESYLVILPTIFYAVAFVYTAGLVIRVLALRDREAKVHRVEIEVRLTRIEAALKGKPERNDEA